jgi:ElaB/YqjD/DUF883 family membrane-anchored ribosome-binding protein
MSASTSTTRIDDHKKKKLEEALDLISQAARDTKEDLGTILKEKYSHLKKDLGGTFEDMPSMDDLKHKSKQAYQNTKDQVQESWHRVDNQVHNNPWPYIGGGALAGLIAGLLITKSNSK